MTREKLTHGELYDEEIVKSLESELERMENEGAPEVRTPYQLVSGEYPVTVIDVQGPVMLEGYSYRKTTLFSPEAIAKEMARACPPMIVFSKEVFQEMLSKGITSDAMIVEGDAESFCYFPPDFAKIDLDVARAHLLRTLELKRCKDTMRNVTWPGPAAQHGRLYQGEWVPIDDPDSFVPLSEEMQKRMEKWYTESLPIRTPAVRYPKKGK